jgi:ribosomal protein S8E
MGRQPSLTKLGEKKIIEVRGRGCQKRKEHWN